LGTDFTLPDTETVRVTCSASPTSVLSTEALKLMSWPRQSCVESRYKKSPVRLMIPFPRLKTEN
jgi:hypothetical protein